jgi:pantoate--beta-alanine ligase
MGYLHEGHLSLIDASVNENDITVCSIFVNPTQFGPNEDYEVYPRDEERDFSLLKNRKCDVVFCPDVKEMYSTDKKVYVDVDELSDVLCGAKRPGHFRGVLTVVAKLFNIIGPDNAYFGEKDYQQFLILKKMVEDLNFPLNIKKVPIKREKDGLAMSSRNVYLNEKERKEAILLYKIINFVKKEVRNGMKTSDVLNMIDNFIEQNADLSIMRKDYVEIRNEKNLKIDEYINENSRIFLAFYCGKTRLIDNSKIIGD